MLLQESIKKLLIVVAISATTWSGFAQEYNRKPNIVFILADDFGYGSLNAYGADLSLVRTPHISRIAHKGMRFTNASTPASICSPTRYGFLTGQYPWRSSLKYGVTHILGELLSDTNRMTVADWLQNRGYHTAAVGKWHLGGGDHGDNEEPSVYTGKVSPGPLDLGFDYHFGVPQNHDDALGVYIENDHIYGIRSDRVQPYSRSFYGQRYIGYDAPQRINEEVMEVLTEKSINWLKKQSSEDPFFLYFASIAVHHPSTPSAHMRGMSDCGPYGDFIQDLDMSVGRIIETLEYMNLLENTVIIFSSDNGGDIPGPHRPQAPERLAQKYGLKINGDLPASKDVAPDSYSFLSTLLGKENPSPRTSMVTADVNGMHALRDGNWKYIDNTPPEGLIEDRLEKLKEFEAQLYDLDKDPGETSNLLQTNPGTAKMLLKKLNEIRNAENTRLA